MLLGWCSPRGGLTTRSIHIDQGLAAFERVDPFGRLPYVLLFKFAIHEERGEDQVALALAARGRDWLARRAWRDGRGWDVDPDRQACAPAWATSPAPKRSSRRRARMARVGDWELGRPAPRSPLRVGDREARGTG